MTIARLELTPKVITAMDRLDKLEDAAAVHIYRVLEDDMRVRRESGRDVSDLDCFLSYMSGRFPAVLDEFRSSK